jgi:hypothetical protein
MHILNDESIELAEPESLSFESAGCSEKELEAKKFRELQHKFNDQYKVPFSR